MHDRIVADFGRDCVTQSTMHVTTTLSAQGPDGNSLNAKSIQCIHTQLYFTP